MSSHDPYAALRIRNNRLYLIGSLVANLGSQMLTVAVGWELYERTGSAMALGWVAACFSAVVSVVSGGVGTILVVLGVTGLWPELRKLRELHQAAMPVTAEEDEERTKP